MKFKLKQSASVILFLLVVAPNVVLRSQTANSQTRKDDETITSEDREALLELSKSVIGRLMITRDWTPLVEEFFADGFGDLLEGENPFLYRVSPQLGRKLTTAQKVRAYIAFMNFHYLLQVSFKVRPDLVGKMTGNGLESILPGPLAARIDRSYLARDYEGDFTDFEAFLEELHDFETAMAEASAELKKRNYERSEGFRSEFERDEKDERLGWNVRASVWRNTDEEERKIAARYGAKYFVVTTPISVVILAVKVNGRVKVLAVGPRDD